MNLEYYQADNHLVKYFIPERIHAPIHTAKPANSILSFVFCKKIFFVKLFPPPPWLNCRYMGYYNQPTNVGTIPVLFSLPVLVSVIARICDTLDLFQFAVCGGFQIV